MDSVADSLQYWLAFDQYDIDCIIVTKHVLLLEYDSMQIGLLRVQLAFFKYYSNFD